MLSNNRAINWSMIGLTLGLVFAGYVVLSMYRSHLCHEAWDSMYAVKWDRRTGCMLYVGGEWRNEFNLGEFAE